MNSAIDVEAIGHDLEWSSGAGVGRLLIYKTVTSHLFYFLSYLTHGTFT